MICKKCKGELFSIELCNSDERYGMIRCEDCQEIVGEVLIENSDLKKETGD